MAQPTLGILMKFHLQSILGSVWKKKIILKSHYSPFISSVRLLHSCKSNDPSRNKKQLGNAVRRSSIHMAYNMFHPKEEYDHKLSPILFYHCMLSCKESWNDSPQIIANKTKRRTYAVVIRNHGDSSWRENNSFEATLEDLHCFMDECGIKETVFVGHSYGAMIGLQMATRHPERIDSVFVSDMSVKSATKEEAHKVLAFIRLCESAMQMLPPDCDEAAAEKIMVDYINEILANNWKRIEGIKEPMSLTRTLAGVKKGSDGRYTLKANTSVLIDYVQSEEFVSNLYRSPFEKPATFVCGSDSFLNVFNDEDIKKYFPKAEIITIEGASHFVHADCPDEFTEIVTKRLNHQ